MFILQAFVKDQPTGNLPGRVTRGKKNGYIASAINNKKSKEASEKAKLVEKARREKPLDSPSVEFEPKFKVQGVDEQLKGALACKIELLIIINSKLRPFLMKIIPN